MSRSDTATTAADLIDHPEPPARTRGPRGAKRGTGKSRAPSSGLRRQLVEQEILERAAQLFAERGFAGTTVGDIAEALGMSRPALYYYVKSKDVLLSRLIENLSITSANEMEAIRNAPEGGPLERLSEMTRALALTAARNPNQAHILAHNKHHLPEDLAKINNDAERTIVRAVMAMLTQGIKDGQVRALDVRTSALAIIGMCLWTAWWSGDEPVELVADRVAEQAVASVLAAGANREVTDPAELLRAARADLERLQASLDS